MRLRTQRTHRPRAGALGACAAALALALACTPPEVPELEIVASPEPWGWATRLIAYRGRLWFATGETEDRNAADLYSLEPGVGRPRFERRLFSQGAGEPLVRKGLLYWPYEDSRFHLGIGMVAVTDGEDWRLLPIPSGEINHVHALAAPGDDLVAAAASLRPLVFRSRDAGRSWQLLHADPGDGHRRVARLLRAAALGDAAFATLHDGVQVAARRSLVRLTAGGLERVPGWPEGAELTCLEPWQGRLCAAARQEARHALWCTDGARSERLGPGPPGRLRDLAAGPDGWLFGLTSRPDGGRIWKSRDGREWEPVAVVRGGRPLELALLGDAPFVGGRSELGATVWGPANAASTRAKLSPAPPLPEPAVTQRVPNAAQVLEQALADPTGYADRGSPLVDTIVGLALADPPQGLFAAGLNGPFPAGEVSVLEGRLQVERATLGRWALLLGMTLARRAEISPAWIAEPWSATPDPQHKYLEPLPGALEAIGWSRPVSRSLMDAMVERLGTHGDPIWLTADLIGALSAQSGQRLAYDVPAWRHWWAAERDAWPERPR